MATIFGDIKPLRNNLIVRNIEKGERKTKGGIILRNDDGKEHGIRPVSYTHLTLPTIYSV